MSESMAPPPKIKRGGGSFAWKIAARQAWRGIGTFFWLNLLLTLLVWGGIWYGVERTAATLPLPDAAGTAVTGAGRYTTTTPDTIFDRFFTVAVEQEEPQALRLHHRIVERLDLTPGTRRFMPSERTGNFWNDPANLRYQIIRRDEAAGGWVVATFRPGVLWTYFRRAFSVLLGFELLSLISGIFKVQRTTRRTLRPISDLTFLAQQSIYAQPAAAEDLHLSGAIDTLNAIDEARLDTRIQILDEREELRGLAEAINSMLDRLDHAYRSQLRFVSDASHELRTPISVIQGYADLLDRWGKEDEATLDEAIAAIRSEASGMKDLVEQLLFLARSDNHSIRLQKERFDLSATVREVARETEMIDKTHPFATDIADGVSYYGDAGLLKQALRILVDNAVKYTPTGERVTIALAEREHDLRLSVSDHGVGIAASDLPHLFDRFFRADASRTRETGGTGLGLSIAKWIADSHGAQIQVVSREGIGTRISLLLDKAAEPPPAQSPMRLELPGTDAPLG